MAAPNILSLSPANIVLPVYELLRPQMNDHTLTFLEPPSVENLLTALPSADFILGDWTHQLGLDSDLLGRATRCKLIVQPTAGYDVIDVAAANRLGLIVANCPGANARAVAEWTVMAMLVALKNVVVNHERTRRGEWWMSRALEEGVYDIGGRTIGILGFGTIGQSVAQRLHGFGVSKILYSDAFVDVTEVEPGIAVERVADIDELCRRSDILSVHVPLTPQTRNLIGAERLAMLGTQGVLVNSSRGAVVDEEALAAALRARTIKAAALDVFSEEPIPQTHPWQELDNVLLSPHISGGTVEARDQMISTALRNIDEVITGHPPQHVIHVQPTRV